MDITSILNVFENIELNEQQVAALDQFFKIHKEKLWQEFLEEIKNSQSQQIDLSEYIKRSDAEKAFELFERDCEYAFELFERDCERAFELFEADAEKAFQAATEDLKQQYTEQMAKALQEIYNDIEERVRKDFMESKEYQTLIKLKELVLPLLEADDHDLIAKLKALSEEKERIEQENKELSKEKIINILMKDIPSEFYETVEKFIRKGKDEDEIIERFNTILEAIEIKEFGIKERKTIIEKAKQDLNIKKFIRKNINEGVTKKTKATKPIIEETAKIQDVDYVFEYETLKKELEKKENTLHPFTEAEYQLLQRVAW